MGRHKPNTLNPEFLNAMSLSSFIWSVADLLRGDYKQSEYGKVIGRDPRSPIGNTLKMAKLTEQE